MSAIGFKITNFYNTTANTARYNWFLSHRFSLSGAAGLQGAKKFGYFCLGMGYTIKDHAVSPFTEFDRPHLLGAQPALASYVNSTLPSRRGITIMPNGYFNIKNESFSVNMGDGGDAIEIRETAKRIMHLITSDTGNTFSLEKLRDMYRTVYLGRGKKGQAARRLDERMFEEALKLLMHEKRVNVNETGEIGYYNQQAIIQEASLTLSRQLVSVDNLHRLAEIIQKTMGDLFRNFDLYLMNKKTGEAFIVIGDRDGSTYEKWNKVERSGVFDLMMNGGSSYIHFPNIAQEASKEGPILPHNIERYRTRYVTPEAVSYCVVPIGNDPGDAVMVKINEWRSKGDNAPNRPFYSRNEATSQKLVDMAIEGLVFTIAERMKSIISSYKGLSLKEIWAAEEKELKVVREMSKRQRVPSPGDEGYEEWVDRNEMEMSRFYDRTTRIFAYITGKLSRAYQVGVIEAIDMVTADIKTHRSGSEPLRMLDAGTGSAYFLERMMRSAAANNIEVRATAIDISKVACAIAKNACRSFGEAVKVSKGNIAKMSRYLEDIDPISPGSQDLVFINYVLQYVPIEDTLKEINKVLKIGGKVLITNFKPKETMRWNEFWTNLRAAVECGRKRTFGHGRAYEALRYLFRFLRHPIAIVRFAMAIDRDVADGIIPENPTKSELSRLIEKHGFRIAVSEETHHYAANRFYAEKIRDL